ncbi:uncharacterized protein LOC105694700 [Orussus abietinus]|uniref:uncharacterized protein LOC105694700 n=1 Tax=Orussus abietinus TaxID=222816 RepID=UPI000626C0A6|nr:uncharacterized protein LOC105694700 [Orussus abietinus]
MAAAESLRRVGPPEGLSLGGFWGLFSIPEEQRCGEPQRHGYHWEVFGGGFPSPKSRGAANRRGTVIIGRSLGVVFHPRRAEVRRTARHDSAVRVAVPLRKVPPVGGTASLATESCSCGRFSGEWYMVAGTPVTGGELSRCGHYMVRKTSESTFTIRYTAISHRRNHPVAFLVNGTVARDVTGSWQLEGSNRILGPFRHIVVSADYGSFLAMLVCAEDSQDLPGRRFAMIWSRGRRLSSKVLQDLKGKLAGYIDEAKILTASHDNCQS